MQYSERMQVWLDNEVSDDILSAEEGAFLRGYWGI